MWAVLNTLSFEDSVDLINRKFEQAQINPFNTRMKESGLVIVETVPTGSGGTRRHKERPVGEQYASRKNEGGLSVKTKVQQGYCKDTISKTVSKSIDITLEMRTLNKVQDIYNAMNFISDVVVLREDLDLSMFISFGTATSYVNKDGETVDISTGDGLAPFSTAHTLTGSATTYRNIVANNPAFSESALELAEELFVTQSYNNLWEQVAIVPDVIYSTDNPTTCNAIKRLLTSTAQVSAPNAGVVNVYDGKYRHEILPRIDMNGTGAKDATKKYSWGLASTQSMSFYHDIYREPTVFSPMAGNNGEDIETLDWTFNTIGMYDSCIVVGRWIVFSKGDGTA